jgi:hypothetical protein
MRLYMAASTEYAQHVIAKGFVGIPRRLVDGGVAEFCEFRDSPPTGIDLSITAGVIPGSEDEPTRITGGPVLVTDPGDFILSIEVPNDLASQREVHEDPPGPWPFREVWLAPEEANRYLDTLKVFDSNDGEEVRPDLVGR